ncbi:MAG: hypothetical protein V3T19_00160 [Acidiferrobacterales bacterium]
MSQLDIAILLVGIVGVVLAGLVAPYAGFVIAFVVGHFFLFCNVFRVSRLPELTWAIIFIGLSTATILVGQPGWLVTALCSLIVTIGVIFREIRKPSYHGVFWRTWNPDLEAWWLSSVHKS